MNELQTSEPPMPNPVELADRAVKAAESVSRWNEKQGMMFGFVLLLVGLVAIFGWQQYVGEQSAVRHEMQQSEREAGWTRFTEAELEKGRQAYAREREKDRRAIEDAQKAQIKALEDAATVNKEVRSALVDLTKAVAAKKSGGMIE